MIAVAWSRLNTVSLSVLCFNVQMPMVEEIEVIHTYLEKHPNCSLAGPEMLIII